MMSSPLPKGPILDSAFLAESRVPEILFGTLFPFVFASLFVFGRFYSRAIIMKTWGADDWWILISWAFGGVALTTVNCLLTHYGSGRHIEALTISDIETSITLGFSARIFYQFTLMTTKFAACAFYFRVFTDRTSKIIIWAMFAFIAFFSVPLLFALIFQCHPIKGAWSMTPAECASDVPLLCSSTVLNIFADVALLSFVIPKIANLRIAKKQKIGLIAVLSLSVLVIIAAVVRLVRILRVEASSDVPWDSYDVDIWAAVELNTGFFCVAAPATKPLLRQIAPGLLSNAGTESAAFPTVNRRYGGGASISRRSRGNNPGFELSSQTNLDLPPRHSDVVDKSWIDFEAKRSESDGDLESVRVMVDAPRKGRAEGCLENQNDVRKFECV